MSNIVFNIAKGRVKEYYNRVKANDPAPHRPAGPDMSDKYYVGDPTEVRLDCGTDISTATALAIEARKPDGTVVTWTGTLVGTSEIKFDDATSRWDQAGEWRMQARVTMPGRSAPYSGKTVVEQIYARWG